MNTNDQFRAGYIAIAGRPNVGKSTLLNRLLDIKLSIISPRPQTTRRSVMGIMNRPQQQVIFLDTPGLLEPKYNLHKAMMRSAQMAFADADVILFMVDAVAIDQIKNFEAALEEDLRLLEKINSQKKPVVLAFNKTDISSKKILLPAIDFFSKHYTFNCLIPISAKSGDGVESLENELIKLLPFHPPYYDQEMLTEQPERFFVSELIREQIFRHYQQEIPYATEVQIEDFKERAGGKDYISASIIIERDSQKGILIGKGGQALKKVGEMARKEIEQLLDRKVFLDLHVKVRKDWRKNDSILRGFGY